MQKYQPHGCPRVPPLNPNEVCGLKMDLPSNPLAKIVRKSCEVLNPDDFCDSKQIKTASGFEGSAFQSMPMLAGNPKCRTLMLLCAAGDPKSRTLMLVCAAGDLKSRTLVSKSCCWRSKVLYPSAFLRAGGQILVPHQQGTLHCKRFYSSSSPACSNPALEIQIQP